jgi:peptidoglycan/LPS O-acetylase OafA/YrhL
MPGPSRHVRALDGVRGLAILLVVLHHAAQFSPTPINPALHVVHDVLQAGWLGVDMFFVLSGYLITGILLDARGEGPKAPAGYFRSFYARRVLRIFPLYYLFLAAVLLFHPTVARHGTWWFWLFLSNVLLAKYQWDAAPPGTAHLWSLAVEEQFYLVWPALIAWLSPRAFRIVTIALIILAPLLRLWLGSLGHGRAAYVLTLPRADALALGACAALLVRDRRRYVDAARYVAGIAAVGLAVLLVTDRLTDQSTLWCLLGGAEFATVLTAAIIYLVVVTPGAFRWLSNRVLVSLGTYSYAIYLIHVPMRRTVVDWVTTYVSGDMPILFCNFVALLAASWIGAWVLWRVVERPALSLKRFVPMPSSPPSARDDRQHDVRGVGPVVQDALVSDR